MLTVQDTQVIEGLSGLPAKVKHGQVNKEDDPEAKTE